MKIAIAINTSWNIYNFRLDLIKRFLELGHSVITIAPQDEYTQKLIDLGCKHRSIEIENSGLNPIRDLIYLKNFKSILVDEKPDIVLSYTVKPNIYGTLACHYEKIPVINNVSGLGTTFLWNKIMKTFIVALYRFSFAKSSFIFFQNKEDQKLFLEEVKIDGDKTHVLPGSGINLDHYSDYPASKKNSNFKFLMISRLLIDKGVVEFCEAAKLLKEKGIDVSFGILGKKDPGHKRSIDLDVFDDFISEGYVDYLGTSEDVREHIALSDCIVLPSYREGTPRTLLEGACMGKPLITTDVPGCKNVVIDNFNGFLCSAKDHITLSQCLERMYLRTPHELAEFGSNSKSLVAEKFDVEIIIEEYLDKINKNVPGASISKRKEQLVSN